MSIYQPAALGHTILALVFYIFMVVFVIYSFLAIYSLFKYGRNRLLSLIIMAIYVVVSSGLYAAAVTNLNRTRF